MRELGKTFQLRRRPSRSSTSLHCSFKASWSMTAVSPLNVWYYVRESLEFSLEDKLKEYAQGDSSTRICLKLILRCAGQMGQWKWRLVMSSLTRIIWTLGSLGKLTWNIRRELLPRWETTTSQSVYIGNKLYYHRLEWDYFIDFVDFILIELTTCHEQHSM